MSTDAVSGRRSRALPFPSWFSSGVVWLVLAMFLVGGCSPDAFLVSDEDRDRNFQRARDAERLGDYPAAAEHYERALERNPRAAAIHLGYATLSEVQLRRYADAVYHYQRYLRLRPDDPRADDIRRRITNCTERLATSVPLVIRSETIARDLESVRGENQSLRLLVTNLLSTVHYWSNEWRRATAVPPQLAPPASPGPATNAAAGGRNVAAAPNGSGTRGGTSRSGYSASPGSSAGAVGGTAPPTRRGYATPPPPSSTAVARYHRAQAGETLESIARRYGVTGAAIRRANPQIEPKRLRAGMDVRIPPR